MEKIVVGNEGCSVELIMDCLEDALVHEVDYENFLKLQEYLGLSEKHIQDIEDCLISESITYLEAYRRVLNVWRDIKGINATLGKLLYSLRSCGYELVTDVISERLYLPMENIHQKIKAYEQKSNPAERDELIKSYIVEHMMRIIDLTTIDDVLVSRLLETKVISKEAYDDLKTAKNEDIKGVRLYGHIINTESLWTNCCQLIDNLQHLKQHSAATKLAKAFVENPPLCET